MLSDSIDKIVTSYFSAVTRVPFVYKGTKHVPKDLVVSTAIFRGFTCPPMCGGCCSRFSLDYLPTEAVPYDIAGTEQDPHGSSMLAERFVEFDGRQVRIISDLQSDHARHHCRNLDMSSGRCGIHGRHPFSCDFELIRAFHAQDNVRLSQQLYGRGHMMLRVDGLRGARCEMLPVSQQTKDDVIRKLMRLKQWCNYFGLKHRVDTILAWAQDVGHTPSTRDLHLGVSE